MGIFSVTLAGKLMAYSYVVTSIMIEHANFFCEEQCLPLEKPITFSELRNRFVGSPILKDDDGEVIFSGNIKTDQYFFGFDKGHWLTYYLVSVDPPRSNAAIKKDLKELATMPSLIDTNGAWQIATNWVIKSGIDWNSVTNKYKPRIEQFKYYPKSVEIGVWTPLGDPVMLPIFSVTWFGDTREEWDKSDRFKNSEAIRVRINGNDMSVLDSNTTYTPHLIPPIKLKNTKTLLAISDEEFLKMSDAQKSNLVKRFVAPESFPPQKKKEQ